jgi:membrane protease YdiL (CAAX protease family)
LAEPDWDLSETFAMISAMGADMSTAPPAPSLLAGLLLASLLAAPFINAVFGFGEELGWRGYLLPKLMPLGRSRAYVAVGAIWGLWHAPLIVIGFNYPGYPVLGIVAMMALTTALGTYINEMTVHHESSILAGWMHGVFNSQAYGIWRVLFPSVNPLLGGMTGLVGIAVWSAVGYWSMRRD